MAGKRGGPRRRSLSEKMAFSSIAKQKGKSSELTKEPSQQKGYPATTVQKIMQNLECQTDMLHIDPIKKVHREIGYER